VDSSIALILAAILALLVGLALGWFAGVRPLSGLRGEAERLRGDVARLGEEKAEALGKAGEREADFKIATKELADSRIEVATLKANAANFDKQMVLMREAREELLKEFQNTGNKVLGEAQEAFLKRAAERFGHSEQASKEAVASLLKPVSERLQNYEKQVSDLEAKRVDAFGQLTGLIEGMRAGQEEVRREAQRLGNSLRNGPKVRGSWGEQQLKNVLEQCGLAEYTDFITEHSVESSEGRLRPDAIVRIPGNKLLIIDSKVSLNDYQDAFEAEVESEKESYLNRHVASMRNHIQTLASKSYQSQFDEAPDYVIMFVPGEQFVAAAIEHDLKQRKAKLGEDALLNADDLWNFAFRSKVLLATPTNLVAIARTVAQVWRQDALAKEAQEIGRMGAELYSRLETASQHLKRVGGGLETAVNNYNKFVGSFERNVLSSGRRLADKGIEIGKREIEEVPLVENAPRYTGSDLADGTQFPKLGADTERNAAE